MISAMTPVRLLEGLPILIGLRSTQKREKKANFARDPAKIGHSESTMKYKLMSLTN